MLIPSRPLHDLTDDDVVAIINAGKIDFALLDTLVPRGTNNTWNANPGDRIQFGFKFEWVNQDGSNWHVHGHAPDPVAPHNSNASNGWVIRIRHGNRWLLGELNVPANGDASFWSRNRNLANKTHIPATSETLRLKRRNSM